MLDAARDLGAEAQLRHLVAQYGHDALDVGVALLGVFGDGLFEFGVVIGFEDGEGEVFQLSLDTAHTQAPGERRVDVARLLGGTLPLVCALRLGNVGYGGNGTVRRRARGAPLRGGVADGTHGAQLIGDLEDCDPRIFGHRDEHLADVLGVHLPLALASLTALARGIVTIRRDRFLGPFTRGAPQLGSWTLQRIEALDIGDGLRDGVTIFAAQTRANIGELHRATLDSLIEQDAGEANGVDMNSTRQCLGEAERI